MTTITKRLERLERAFAPALALEDVGWGGMAHARDTILHLAGERGHPCVAEMRMHLDALGPHGLWMEAVRGYLMDHGFVQTGSESFAETIARALSISTHELAAWIGQGRIGAALIERFSEPRVASDNTN